ncbi:NADPH-dependent FMN reductase [Adhaeribacter soli]|uniref:NAD(P)H-dependent oxidoreductase n=1 Tax=Adhaeribacter soli TaxID=2607655 RepID=A0A5N1IYA1_9BACT|nr:NAD(P)H-dependent oxidoreductase [Adhaeribacter soli]KAA9338897.1 NAD(P)H-dependent oxidoreductase [Adhaeribacter soli]
MITIIVGTNRNDSISRLIAEQYADMLLQKFQQPTQLLDLQELPVDFISTALYEHTGKNEAFNAVSALIAGSEKFVFVLPEYNGSFPGVLKAFIDGLAYPNTFRHKKAAMLAISNGTQGGLLAMSHLTDIFNYLGMHVLANKVRIPQVHNHMAEGKIITPFYLELMELQAEQFLSF